MRTRVFTNLDELSVTTSGCFKKMCINLYYLYYYYLFIYLFIIFCNTYIYAVQLHIDVGIHNLIETERRGI